jgi:transcription-repair coupling factor (superfamily II helicase)
MSLITSPLTASPPFQRVVQLLKDYEDIPNLALSRAARPAVAAALQGALGGPLLIIVDRADQALTLLEELDHWAPGAARLSFPEPTPLFYDAGPWSEATRRERITTLTALAAYHMPGLRVAAPSGYETPEHLSRAEHRRQVWAELRDPNEGGPGDPIFVATVRAMMSRTLPRRDFIVNTRQIKTGQQIQPAELARSWVRIGYEHADTVIAPGQFARRGGLLDIWPPAEPLPVRIDFFGDEVDSLRQFDPATQRTEAKVERMLVTPAREFMLPRAAGMQTVEAEDSSSNRDQPDVLTDRQAEGIYTEFDIPTLHPPSSLLNYLPEAALIVIDDSDAVDAMSHEIETQALEMKDSQVQDGALSPNTPQPYTAWGELFDEISFRRHIVLGPASAIEKSDLARLFSPNPRFGGRVKAVLDHLLHQVHRGDRSIVISRQATRLSELYREQVRRDTGTGGPAPEFITASLAEGFVFAPPGENRIHVIGDGEIFGWRRPQPRRRVQSASRAPETVYADMQVGDWVVHIDHGIGRFMGLVRRHMDGMDREFLAVEYDDGDELFVPVHQADRLTRYVGPDGRTPQATRLGSNQWKKRREQVEEAVAAVAEDLLDLYARRKTVEGFAFSADSDWQRELEASFPYTETEDQERVIIEVKRDMEALRPMDRLICGDVGYGKTEVALRAAFKAIYDGRQVAMLVPTTVLAQQHYHTFRDRLASFPIKVEMLSRFRSDKQQREILLQVAAGEIDMVVGTHRLLSGDVVFDNLGLLIIDEEQRFGVAHKEKLKQLRTEVDVLTMTATPIPRTLYMALTGVRDISTINTPPEERLPIVTHVGPYSPKRVRQAILRELERGGQIFFVHNRVQTIYGMQTHLEKLIPEARLRVGHGQMAEAKLSQVMREFTAGEVDVLLSTSIIESGLDIPNANTLIVDRADTFGLAQLYQLRGRVGRGTHQAYSYFFKHRKKPPTIEGRERLETLAEHTDLGAGYAIAMRDLEIRGAGDLLGTRQSGHIAAVGFHMYTRLLAEAVQQSRRGQDTDDLPLSDLAAAHAMRPAVNIDLPIPAGIPPSYIIDQDVRLRLYRRIADIRDAAAIDRLRTEFTDRFGEPPQEVEDLFYQIRTKLLAESAGLTAVVPEAGQLVLRYPRSSEEDALDLPYLGPDVRRSKTGLRLLFNAVQGDWRARLIEVLEAIQPPRP